MKNALVVDDEEIQRGVVSSFLRRAGNFKINEVESGVKAVEFIRGNPLDLVITDLEMPNGDGKFVYDFIRVNKPRVPVLVCTGAPNMLPVYGFDDGKISPLLDYLIKPYTFEQFEGKVSSLVGL